MILFDIDVHREVPIGTARYFGVDNPVALADHLLQASQEARELVVRNVAPHQDDSVRVFAMSFSATMRQAVSRPLAT